MELKNQLTDVTPSNFRQPGTFHPMNGPPGFVMAKGIFRRACLRNETVRCGIEREKRCAKVAGTWCGNGSVRSGN